MEEEASFHVSLLLATVSSKNIINHLASTNIMSSVSVASDSRLLRINYVVTMGSSSISTICSATLAFFIWKKGTEERFATPFRRYMFAICICDIMQSSAFLFGPLAVPKDVSPDFFLAKGNLYTCVADGVVLLMGGYGIPFYMIALTTSFLLKIKHNVKDKDFIKKYDLKIHIAVAVWTVVLCTAIVATKNLYPTKSGSYCFPTLPYPYGCDEDPLQFGECKRNKHGNLISLFTIITVAVFTFICIVVQMVKLVRHVVSIGDVTRRRFRQSMSLPMSSHPSVSPQSSRVSSMSPPNSRFSAGSSTQERDESNPSEQEKTASFVRRVLNYFKNDLDDGSSPLNNFQTTQQKKAKQREREITIQALLYAGCFLFIYMWPIIGTVRFAFGKKATTPKEYFDTFHYLSLLFYPLGGLLNVIVYTRQKCNVVRSRRNCSRLSAFGAVVAHGGDLPLDCQPRTGRRSRGQPRQEDSPKTNRMAFIGDFFHNIGSWFGNLRSKRSKPNDQQKANDSQDIGEIIEQTPEKAESKTEGNLRDIDLIEDDTPKPAADMALESGISIDDDDRLESCLSIEEDGFVESPPSVIHRQQSEVGLSIALTSIPESFIDEEGSMVPYDP